jgi:hypothetical protein
MLDQNPIKNKLQITHLNLLWEARDRTGCILWDGWEVDVEDGHSEKPTFCGIGCVFIAQFTSRNPRQMCVQSVRYHCVLSSDKANEQSI